MVQIGPIGTGNMQSKLNINGAVNNIGQTLHEAANDSFEVAVLNGVKRIGENMRGRINSLTGGNFLNGIGQNIRR